MNYVRQVMNPAWYHGYNKKPPFFEGWYFKVIDPTGQQLWAFISGMFLHDAPNRTHAFIQVLNGTSGEAYYHRYAFEDFHAQPNAFDVRVGNSHFQQDLHVTDTRVEWVLTNNHHELIVQSERARGGLLKEPQRDDMHLRVDETMQAEITVELNTLNHRVKQTLFQGCGRNAALEVVGNLEKITTS